MKFDDFQKIINFPLTNTQEDQAMLYQRLRELGIDPANLYQELEMTSDYINTHRDITYSNATISLHSHSYYEIIFCRTTANVEYLVGSERYRLQAGDIIIVPPRVSHRPILPENITEPYIRDVIWISQTFWDNLIKMFPDDTQIVPLQLVPLRTAGTKWRYIDDLFHKGVLEEESKYPGWQMSVTANTIMILTALKRAAMEHIPQPVKAEKPELLDQIASYIENYYAYHITIGDLARQFYVSESTISHLFKQKMGVSIYRFITQRRLIAAKALINQGKSLEHVSREVGFTDYSTFYRAFKQEFGISPRQFGQLGSNSASFKPLL